MMPTNTSYIIGLGLVASALGVLAIAAGYIGGQGADLSAAGWSFVAGAATILGAQVAFGIWLMRQGD